MTEFAWQNSYLIGNRTIDQQHQRLFELANNLVDSNEKTTLLANAMLLYRHVREHFQEEEAFMKSCDYRGYQHHVDMHNLMLSKLVDVSEKINNGEWQRQQVLEFMHDWIRHILDEDALIQDESQSDLS